jgi:hypothetical protein
MPKKETGRLQDRNMPLGNQKRRLDLDGNDVAGVYGEQLDDNSICFLQSATLLKRGQEGLS